MTEAAIHATKNWATAMRTAIRTLGHCTDARPQGGRGFPFDRVGAASIAVTILSLAITVGLAMAFL
jgi:hypothetical protein